MQFVRKFLLVLLVPLFTILLYTVAIDVGFARIGTQPAAIKHILVKSGIYSSVVPSLLDQAKQVSGSSGTVSLTDPVVRAAANQTFSPQLVQNDTEAVIDGTYDWLNGTTPLPDFQIDLSSAKSDFAANVAKQAEQHLQGLPACPASSAVNFDPLHTTCLPAGVTPASAAAVLQSTIANGKGFLDSPVITANSIKSGNNNQPIFANQLKQVPEKYRLAKKTPLVLGALVLILGLAILFLSSTRSAGLKRIGIPLLVVGLLLLAFAWGSNHVTTKFLVPKVKVNNVALQNSVRVLVVNIEQAIDKSYWWFGAGYTALGVTAISGSMYINRQRGLRRQPAVATSHQSAPPPPPPAQPVQHAHHPGTPATPIHPSSGHPPSGPKPRRVIKIQ